MTINTDTIIWATSQRSKYAHAYAGEKALKAGAALCGRICTPTQSFEHFDLDNELVQKIACPECRARLAFAKFMKPLYELIQERKAAENTS